MRTLRGLVGMALLAPALVAAQEPAPTPPPTGVEEQRLRELVEQRFAERVKVELSLTDEQAGKLRQTAGEFARQRRELEARDRDLRRQLQQEMRPGVAADDQRVARLTEELASLRAQYARSFQDELRALDFLNGVQRARYFELRERLMQRVRELRERRMQERRDAMTRRRP